MDEHLKNLGSYEFFLLPVPGSMPTTVEQFDAQPPVHIDRAGREACRVQFDNRPYSLPRMVSRLGDADRAR